MLMDGIMIIVQNLMFMIIIAQGISVSLAPSAANMDVVVVFAVHHLPLQHLPQHLRLLRPQHLRPLQQLQSFLNALLTQIVVKD